MDDGTGIRHVTDEALLDAEGVLVGDGEIQAVEIGIDGVGH